MEINIGALIGLYGGVVAGLMGWWYGRKKAREQRGLDELHDHVWTKAKAYSWYCTLVALYVLFSLVIFGVKISGAVILGILLMVHLTSWAMAGVILNIRYTYHDPGD